MLKKDAESETVFMILDNAGSQGMIGVEKHALILLLLVGVIEVMRYVSNSPGEINHEDRCILWLTS